MDEKTLELERLLLQIALTAQQHKKLYYVGGGIAVDLTFGGLSRPHEDLDFYPLEEDTQWWKNWFQTQGYTVSTDTDMDPLPNAFSVLRKSQDNFNKDRDYIADVYPVAISDNGEISMAVKASIHEVWDGMLTVKGTREVWLGKSWNDIKTINYQGQDIVVENYQTVLAQKAAYIQLHPGEKLTEKHLFDFARAGIKPEV